MRRIEFSAIGTEWCILLDEEISAQTLRALFRDILTLSQKFDEKYSRFLPHSWINSLRTLGRETKNIQLSPEEQEIFSLGTKLEKLSEGSFSLNLTNELEHIGYDQNYSLQPKATTLSPKGRYWLEKGSLYLEDRVSFDIGAYGKGFLIDRITHYLQKKGLTHFLVDGSGDFWGSTKKGGSGWEIALEHPKDSTLAIGTLHLKNAGFASSGTIQRKWGSQHHLLEGVSGKPASSVVATFVTAPTAVLADALATAYFVTPEKLWKRWHTFSHSWCVVEEHNNSLQYRRSPTFIATFFS